MGFVLGEKASAAGYRLAAYDTIGSTSTEALERAAAGDPGALWVVSQEQTAGHGRRGRAWSTPAGNLAASLLLTFSTRQDNAATLGFVAGLALHDGIRASMSSEPPGNRMSLRLKWPNDVLMDGAKVAGILLQATAAPGGSSSVVIGVGVNVVDAPVGLPYPATSLRAVGAKITAEHLFAALSDSWIEYAGRWNEGRGFPEIRKRWLERAAGLGSPIAVQTGADVLEGIFDTIDEGGRLIVRTAGGALRSVAAGDVHFGLAASAAVA